MSVEVKPLVDFSFVNVENFKKIGRSAGKALLALVSLVVTVVSAALILIVKAFTFFVPKDYSKKIDWFLKIGCYIPLYAAVCTASFSCAAIGEFQDPAKREANVKAIDAVFNDKAGRFKESILVNINKFTYAHINGSNLV